MTRLFHATALEALATYWQVRRRDGVALGFTSHDRDLWFDGLLHRAAPGMVPRAIRQTASLEGDSAEVEGALTHDSISAADLADGRYDGAAITIGVIDWETLEHAALYRGRLGDVETADGAFTAQLRSAKTLLELNPVPQTSPLCRAVFCGPGCNLSAARFTTIAAVSGVDPASERIAFAGIDPALHSHGELRWIDGPLAGLSAQIIEADAAGLLLDRPLRVWPAPGTRARLKQGCDRTLATCHARFANAANFRGEPFLPGNDLVARYPKAS